MAKWFFDSVRATARILGKGATEPNSRSPATRRCRKIEWSLPSAAMRWLLHGTLTPAVADALRQRGDTVVEGASVGLTSQPAHADVLRAAHKAQLDLMTHDPKLAEAPFAQGAPPFGRCIVYLQLEGGDVEQDDAVTRLFERYKRLTPGRLYTVTGSRVKIRQLPGQP